VALWTLGIGGEPIGALHASVNLVGREGSNSNVPQQRHPLKAEAPAWIISVQGLNSLFTGVTH
jgi:hypothetical protein